MTELTNRLRKMVASLSDAKARKREKCFVAEGTKCVTDTWQHFTCRHLFATAQWIAEHPLIANQTDTIQVKAVDLERMTHLSTPPQVIAVYDLPFYNIEDINISSQLVLALDRIQDPGNLGTIIRIADWFGINTIVCSYDTVDAFNPKVIQATMGAISRVKVVYTSLSDFLCVHSDIPIYGTFLDGRNIYQCDLSTSGIIIMGNEGQGISDEVATHVSNRLLIPAYPPNSPTSESLNVSMATAITVAEFRRRASL